METIGNWFLFLLVNSTWQIAGVVLVTLICDRLLRKTGARVRHVLWVTALLASIVLPILSGFGMNQASNEESIQTVDVRALASAMAPDKGIAAEESRPTASLLQISALWVTVLFAGYLLWVFYSAIRLAAAFRRALEIRRSASLAREPGLTRQYSKSVKGPAVWRT